MVVHYMFSVHPFSNPNHGDPAPLKQLGINHVHLPTHAPPAAASVNQRGCHFCFSLWKNAVKCPHPPVSEGVAGSTRQMSACSRVAAPSSCSARCVVSVPFWTQLCRLPVLDEARVEMPTLPL
jgi:hypothetical protein